MLLNIILLQNGLFSKYFLSQKASMLPMNNPIKKLPILILIKEFKKGNS
jgi:hypothetical protein